ncbi:hypothetical protein PHLGIDRAFT_322365 [Phlebiopsis gigantea 11061_1 CR5-6]|uniref:DUF6533 domain-containing protein n=1 Tax=Phlebiopsis gigantea (strain 11061_1 CR5-6) TaxID=745531 RepID=A0A0C3SD60_PHLG1|nr:hypothetical protein PHLGIDRAFT_322365 [Phlebiopsis gigantea 11061_1 CR5-6]
MSVFVFSFHNALGVRNDLVLGLVRLPSTCTMTDAVLCGGRTFTAVAYTVICYDYMLFLPDEIKLFWRREASQTSLRFYCTRYATLFGHIPIVYAAFAEVKLTGSLALYA